MASLIRSLRRAVAPALVAVCFAPAPGVAAGAPAAALNKTVTLSFTSSGMARPVSGGAEYGYNTLVSYIIYVSGEGRVFMRSSQQSGRGRASRSKDISPDGGSGGGSFHFQGNNLVGVVQFASGARQVTLAFDGGFSSCSPSMIEGRTNGATIRRKAPTGIMVDILSSTISSPSCAVQSGNAFAH